MHPVIQKTLGGLSPQYYFRQLFFGLLVAAFAIFMLTYDGKEISVGALLFVVVSTLLYPYSRFVYENIVSFIIGNNVFFVNAVLMLITKFVTMVMCWKLSILIAPIGLAYLYYHHSKADA